MSVANLKEYVRRCATEPELREKARALATTDMEHYMRHAESLGLEWSQSDMVAFRKEVIEAEGGLSDLTEEELGQVAGGAVTVTAALAVGVGVGVAALAGAATSTTVGSVTAAGGGGW